MSATLDSKEPSGPIEDRWDDHRFHLKLVNPANKRKYNIIVVGTGLAGASAAASLACVSTWLEDFRLDLTRIDVPTLVIHGDADRILPIAASGLRTGKLIKDARMLVVKDGPHCITWTHADEVNRALLNFLGE